MSDFIAECPTCGARFPSARVARQHKQFQPHHPDPVVIRGSP